jgi:hypothetical protein
MYTLVSSTAFLSSGMELISNVTFQQLLFLFHISWTLDVDYTERIFNRFPAYSEIRAPSGKASQPRVYSPYLHWNVKTLFCCVLCLTQWV